jgi:hypothetical protein
MKADILACYPSSWISYVISYFTDDEITHLALQIDDKTVLESSWFGIKKTDIKQYENRFLRLRCINLTDQQREDVVNTMTAMIGTPYDYKLLLGHGIELLLQKIKAFFGFTFYSFTRIAQFNNPKKDICVEAILMAYFKGIKLDLMPEEDSYNVLPHEILKSPHLTIIK